MTVSLVRLAFDAPRLADAQLVAPPPGCGGAPLLFALADAAPAGSGAYAVLTWSLADVVTLDSKSANEMS